MQAQTKAKLRHGAAAGLRTNTQYSGYFLGVVCLVVSFVALAEGKPGPAAALLG